MSFFFFFTEILTDSLLLWLKEKYLHTLELLGFHRVVGVSQVRINGSAKLPGFTNAYCSPTGYPKHKLTRVLFNLLSL